MKICNKCRVEKSEDQFYKNLQCRGGLTPQCKSCAADAQRIRNKNKDKQKIEDYRKNYNFKNKQKLKQYYADYYLKNKDKYKNNSAAWYAANKDKKKLLRQKWREENKEASRAHWHNRVRRQLGKFSVNQVRQLLERQDWFCASPICGADLKLVRRHLDHKEPIIRGGANTIENLQWLCESCNLAKGTLSFAAWLERVAPRIEGLN